MAVGDVLDLDLEINPTPVRFLRDQVSDGVAVAQDFEPLGPNEGQPLEQDIENLTGVKSGVDGIPG